MAKKDAKVEGDSKAAEEEIIEDNVVAEEKRSQKESEIDELRSPEENISGQEVDLEDVEEETQTQESVAPEVAAINTDTEVALEADKKAKLSKEKTTKKKREKGTKKPSKPKVKSKKYKERLEKIEGKIYPISDGVKAVKEASFSKFDGTISLALRIEKNKKSDDAVRGTIRLPHGTGKKLKVEIATDDLVEKIKKGKTDFDILVASPEMMPKLAQVAKILGPKGKMPNPKDGTVVEDPKTAVEDLGGNVVRYRTDLGNNIHMPIGKVSWDEKKIEENLRTVLKSLARFKIASATLSPTMGPGVKIESK